MTTDYLELNREVLERLKEENPVKYRSLKRYLECQNIYAEAVERGVKVFEGWSQPAAHWNAWAEKLLAERKKLEENGEWQATTNQPMRDWLDAAMVDFSKIHFLQENGKDDADEEEDSSGKSFYPVVVKALRFDNFTFPSNVNFSHTTFSGEANFFFTNFKGEATFENAVFKDIATFLGANFIGKAIFRNIMFNNKTDFEFCKFNEDARFGFSIFKENALFRYSVFFGEAAFRYASFKKSALFNHSKFNSESFFISIHGGRDFDLSVTQFLVAPDFNRAVFNKPPVLDSIFISEQLTEPYWRPFGWRYPFKSVPEPQENARHVSRNFRALGKMAHEARDWLNEMEFFAQEIRCRRFGEDFPLPPALAGLFKAMDKMRARWRDFQLRRRFWPFTNAHEVLRHVRPRPCYDARVFGPRAGRFWFGMIYEKLSNFGRSFVRPVVGWLASVLAFAVYYFLSAVGGGFGDALTLSIREGLVVSGLLRSGHLQTLLKRLYGLPGEHGRIVVELSNWVAGAMMLQTLISAFLLFLFFLAVRNHFRIR